MKQSRFNGKYIYDQIKKVNQELQELGTACDLISDDLGQHHVAYKLLNEQYKNKQAEIRNLENMEYMEVITPKAPLVDYSDFDKF
jgi:hypothetical protein